MRGGSHDSRVGLDQDFSSGRDKQRADVLAVVGSGIDVSAGDRCLFRGDFANGSNGGGVRGCGALCGGYLGWEPVPTAKSTLSLFCYLTPRRASQF